MKQITTKPMPHGTIPFAQVRDPQTRDALMKINENMRSLDRRLKAVEEAARKIWSFVNMLKNTVDANVRRLAALETRYGVVASFADGSTSDMGTALVAPASVLGGSGATWTAVAKDGYDFVGWYSTADAGGDAVSTDATYTTNVGADAVLYAKFAASSQT